MQVIQKVAHEFVGILLLIAPGSKQEQSVTGEALPVQPDTQEAKRRERAAALYSEQASCSDPSFPLVPCFICKISKGKTLQLKNKFIQNIRANWTCSDFN